jgi:hypothetical protein
MVEGQRQRADLAHDDLAIDHPGGVLDLAERQDGRLAGGEDGGAAVDAEHPDVGDRDRAAGQVGRGGLPGPGRLGELGQRPGKPGQRQPSGVLDVRHDEAALGRDRDAEVHVVLDHDLLGLLVPRGVDHRMPGRRGQQRPGHEQQRRHPQPGELGQLADPPHRGHRLGDVGLQELGDVRRGERAAHHGGGHVLADPADRDALFAGSLFAG